MLQETAKDQEETVVKQSKSLHVEPEEINSDSDSEPESPPAKKTKVINPAMSPDYERQLSMTPPLRLTPPHRSTSPLTLMTNKFNRLQKEFNELGADYDKSCEDNWKISKQIENMRQENDKLKEAIVKLALLK